MANLKEVMKDTEEFAELLREKSPEEKMFIKGIIIGARINEGPKQEDKKAG